MNALLDHVARDQRYWQKSGGGITVSGGEPLIQIDPMIAFLKACGERGWHRCIETAGAVPLESIKCAAEHMDMWLWDIKATDSLRFKQGTQGSSQLVRDNLRWLLSQDANVIIRTPLINGFNAEKPAWEAIAQDLNAMPRRVPLFILPGHECGTAPADCITSPMVEPDITQAACDYLNAQHIPTQITW